MRVHWPLGIVLKVDIGSLLNAAHRCMSRTLEPKENREGSPVELHPEGRAKGPQLKDTPH